MRLEKPIEAIFAVMNTTKLLVEIKPEKNQAPTGF